jgi:hypothetical protein
VKIDGHCLVKGEYQSHPDVPEMMGRNHTYIQFMYCPTLRDHERNGLPNPASFLLEQEQGCIVS